MVEANRLPLMALLHMRIRSQRRRSARSARSWRVEWCRSATKALLTGTPSEDQDSDYGSEGGTEAMDAYLSTKFLTDARLACAIGNADTPSRACVAQVKPRDGPSPRQTLGPKIQRLKAVSEVLLTIDPRSDRDAGCQKCRGDVASPIGERNKSLRIGSGLGAKRVTLRAGTGEIELLEPEGNSVVADELARRGRSHLFGAGATSLDPRALVHHTHVGRS